MTPIAYVVLGSNKSHESEGDFVEAVFLSKKGAEEYLMESGCMASEKSGVDFEDSYSYYSINRFDLCD